jgi:hypothetical protein
MEVMLAVPLEGQPYEHYGCGKHSAEMLWRFRAGDNIKLPWKHVDEEGLCHSKEADVDNDDLATILMRLFDCRVRQGACIQEIVEAIDEGHPVLINFLIPYDEGDPNSKNPDAWQFHNIKDFPLPNGKRAEHMDGHYCVVVGYREEEGERLILILNDPLRARIEIAAEEFLCLWRAYYSHHTAWMIVAGEVREHIKVLAVLG